MDKFFEETLRNPLFTLPIRQKDSDNYESLISNILHSYLEIVESIPNGSLNVPKMNFPNEKEVTEEFVKEFQRNFVGGILKSIKEYLDGSPSRAYSSIDEALKNYAQEFHKRMNETRFDGTNSFYRIRKANGNYSETFSKKEMFHIPFSQRGRVSTQRFSIPGFPSLYLGDSIYICWEELNRPDVNFFQAARLETTMPLKLLDLSPPPENINHERVSYSYFMTWPLIAACCVNVKNYLDPFKPEYIVHQLLLQWVRANSDFDGIRYKSNRLASEMFKQNGKLHNIVLPVKDRLSSDLCRELKGNFKLTEAVSWPIHQLVMGGMDAIYMGSGNNPKNQQLPPLELIRGHKRPYGFSIFGKLESILDGMPAEFIED